MVEPRVTDDTPNDWLAAARELGQEAGRILCRHRDQVAGRASAAEIKRDGSLVTEADRAADRYLRQAVLARFPDHAVLSEESESRYDGQSGTWVVDPLDGTNNYALGICYWGCSIAVLQDGVPAVGVVVMPLLEAEFWAVRGGGAYLNGTRLGDPSANFTEQNSFIALCSRSVKNLDLPVPYKGRLLGSAAYDLAALAQGIAVAVVQVMPHVWDVAAGWLLAREAGRVVQPLLPGAPEPFPLQPGVDYRDRVFPLLAAADPATLARLQERIRLKPEVATRFEALAAAGWDLGQMARNRPSEPGKEAAGEPGKGRQ